MTEQIETETFGILSNIDISILSLNKIIKKDGYEFVPIKLSELEISFSEVFYIPREYKPSFFKGNAIFNLTTDRFKEALKYYFALNLYSEDGNHDDEVYLLKKINNCFIEQGDNYILLNESILAESELVKYVKRLMRILRLYKKGQIEFQGYFSIFKNERRVISKHKTPKTPIHDKNGYKISDDDLDNLNSLLRTELEIPELLTLALESFELTYETEYPKIKFVLFMIALESIFNRSSHEPISHILSRHSALLLSATREEFDSQYKKIKDLYNTRSTIVHGSTDENNLKKFRLKLPEHLIELEDLTRKIILKCISLKDIDNKDSLFNYLNKKGFEG